MKWLAQLWLLIFLTFTVHAQESTSGTKPDISPAQSQATYAVTVIEIRMDTSPDPKLTPEEILTLLGKKPESDQLRMVETVRLSLITGIEQMVTFGKQIPVAIGSTNTPLGRNRNYQMQNIGTMLRATATPTDGQVLLQLTYEASRHTSKGSDETPPEVFTTRISGSHLLQFGVPKLIASTSTEESTFVIVSITQK